MSSRKDLNLPREARPQLNLDGSSNEGSGGGGGGANACLPRPASTGTGPAGSRRKLISKLSFKLREAQADLAVVSPKALRQKPMAGTSIPYCPVEKRIPDCWSPIEPSAFKVRGKNYLR